jgi:tetratricopeptide (TPR) repeat protein
MTSAQCQQTAKDWTDKGLALHHQGKYDEAIKAYDEALMLNSNYADAWYYKGAALYLQGKYDKAVKAYDEATMLDPNDAAYWSLKGDALKIQGKYDDAIKAYDEAIRLDPNDAMARNNKKAAEVSLDNGKETEAALTSDVALGNKENPIIIPLTPTQKDFLNLVVDDLRKIGNTKTAENLTKYMAEKHVSFSNQNPGSPAWVDPNKIFGTIPVVSNELTIQQQEVNNWGKSKDMASIRSMAFTLIHEDVHMNQYLPDEVPEDENEAYETQIREERRVINEDMQKIREIQGRGANLPGDQDKLNELIEDLKVSCNVYVLNTQAFEPEVIAKGYVDPERFKTTVSDMTKLVKEARDLIKSVEGVDPSDALGWYNKGSDLFIQGKYEEALTAFDESIKLDPNLGGVWWDKYYTLYELHRPTEAEAVMDTIKSKRIKDTRSDLDKGITNP